MLEGVPSALPAMIKAFRVQDKVRGVGFDWKQKQDVWKKVREELESYKRRATGRYGKMEEESVILCLPWSTPPVYTVLIRKSIGEDESEVYSSFFLRGE